MVTQAPRRSAVLGAIAFALSCIALMIFVWTQFSGPVPFAAQGYRVHALFAETGLLVPGADVRIAGINVGKVAAVQNRGINSEVTLDIQQQYAPIPVSTNAILRQKTLLGEAFVQLSPGASSGRKIGDGGAIPSSQIAPTQQLDQVLSAFGRPTQADLEAFLTGSATSLAGTSEDLSNAIGNFDPAASDLQAIFETLDEQRANLGSLVRNTGTVLTTLGQRGADLTSLISAGDQVFSATAARNTSLSATVDALPPFLAQLRSTLTLVNTSLGLAKPSLDALLPAAPLLQPALRDVIALSGPTVDLLHRAPRLEQDAIVALPAITRFNRTFHPALDALVPALEQIAPMIGFVGIYHRELVTAMANLAAGLQATAPAVTSSGSAGYLRSLAIVGNDTPFGQSIREPTNRTNTYLAPGGFAYVGKGGMLSANCNNTGNPSQSGLGFPNVPCRLQPGFRWNGLTRYFPHVTAGSHR
jgi:phospholipid/cholesterol/gamma-HCH transport system substrate-binding protein